MLTQIRRKKLEANIWKFYLYRIFSSMIFTIPIFILYLQSNGLSMTQIMVLQAIYSFLVMILVVPAGIVADYIGKKKVIIFQAVLFSVSFLLYALSHTFWQFFVAEVMFAVTAAAWLATGTAFFYDTLKELGQEGTFKRRFGIVTMINYIFWGLASLAGGYIAVNGFRLNYFATAIIMIIALLITFTFTDPKYRAKQGIKYLAHLKEAVIFSAKHPKVRLFIIYSAILLSVGFATSFLYQPYLKNIGIPLVYFGWIYFATEIVSAVSARFAYKLDTFLGEKNILFLLLGLAVVSFLGMFGNILIFGAGFLIILAFVWGIFDPVMNDYVNKHVESHHRSTVLSLNNLATELGSTIFSPFIGWIVDFWSLQTAFFLSAIILVIDLVILIAIYMIAGRKK